ncbi:MAG: helix-turn-helix transcriptional regulator [Erysipelotrichaceae bacterium]|nr:helix-turn-helix transcriptional regulator [Erysipelotrichaceae bacterium]
MQNIKFFSQIMQSIYQIYLWIYDQNGTLIECDCPDEKDFSFLLNEQHLKQISLFFKQHSKPMIYTTDYLTNWITDFKHSEEHGPVVVLIGPFFLDAYPKQAIREEMDLKQISLQRKDHILSVLNTLPVIGFTRIMEYTVMSHFALTSERISTYDLHINPSESKSDNDEPDSEETTAHGTYEAEREMLRMVREGDLGILEYMKKMASIGNIGKMANEDSEPLRQMRNALLVEIVLFSRAAIEGGLYPDTAMTLTDRYFQSVEAAKNFQDLTDVAIAVQNDFVGRVHKIKTNRDRSKTVNQLIDYIELHLEDNISLEDMASEFGYSEYYLSKKFRKETGETIKEFIRQSRLKRAAHYLVNTNLSVSSISEKLRFSSQSYFISKFKEEYGVTPNEYKLKN